MSTSRLRNFLADVWQPLLLYGGLFIGLGALLFFKLGKMLPGYSGQEAEAYHISTELRGILDNPINAPFTLATHGLSYISDHSYLLTRVAAVMFGLLTLIAFCWLLNHWYGRRVAIFGTILFGASAGFLHTARFGAPEVLVFLLVVLVACGVWLKKTSNPFALLCCFLLSAALLYVPGMVWLVALGIMWQWRTIDRIFKRHLWIVTLGGLFLVAALAPLGWAIYHTPELWKVAVGLPAEGWPQVMEVLRNLYQIPMSFFFRFSDANPQTWLGNLAILDIFGMAMVFLGGYTFFRHAGLQRVRLITAIMLVSILLISLGAVSISLLLPFIYILIAAGIGLLLERWFDVFPRNPIAHVLAFSLVSLAILTACSYQMRHYYVAWPRNIETKAVYTIPEPPVSDTIK